MGYDLQGLQDESRYFRFNIRNWGKALRLAESFGWEPEGTTLNDNWDGGYFSNDGQIVSANDAKAIADAIEKAISELHKSDEYQGSSDSDLEYYRQHLTKFIEFCRNGAFRIY